MTVELKARVQFHERQLELLRAIEGLYPRAHVWEEPDGRLFLSGCERALNDAKEFEFISYRGQDCLVLSLKIGDRRVYVGEPRDKGEQIAMLMRLLFAPGHEMARKKIVELLRHTPSPKGDMLGEE